MSHLFRVEHGPGGRSAELHSVSILRNSRVLCKLAKRHFFLSPRGKSGERIEGGRGSNILLSPGPLLHPMEEREFGGGFAAPRGFADLSSAERRNISAHSNFRRPRRIQFCETAEGNSALRGVKFPGLDILCGRT
jgi:hypothetical protein